MAERRQGLKEQLELLWELQKIDLELKNIKEEKDRYPKEMKKLDEKQKIEKERIQKEREKEMGVTLDKIEGERKKAQEKMAHDEKAWNEQMERREVLSKQIESKLFKLYNTLKEKRQGVGVVSAKSETCQGCFVNVPPQMFIEVQKNNILIRCPNCNRILYWEGDRNRK